MHTIQDTHVMHVTHAARGKHVTHMAVRVSVFTILAKT